jgi:putative transcriptional regulator
MNEVVFNSLHEARVESSLTQELLAEKIGVSRQTIIAIEKGNYIPSVLLSLKLARFFKKSVEDLFYLTK